MGTGECAFCLACYRCCPHGAIYWSGDNKPVITTVACRGCGICKSEKGSLCAGWRAANAQGMLEAIGIEKDRICFATTASNLGADFSGTLMKMEKTLPGK